MNSPAIGSRKRPFAVVDDNRSSGGGEGPTKPDEDVDPSGDGGSDADDDGDSDGDGDGGEDLPEIVNLRKALEYLIDVRDAENTSGEGDSNGKKQQQRSNESQSPQLNTASAEDNGANEEAPNDGNENMQLYMVPNLVNGILMEHYSFNHRPRDHEKQTQEQNSIAASTAATDENAKRSPSRVQRQLMTELLIAVIVEFAEPYLARMARHRQLERARLLRMQQRQQHAQQPTQETLQGRKKGRLQKNEAEDPLQNVQSSLPDFDKRAVSWATSCLTQLLRPQPVASPGSKSSAAAGSLSDDEEPSNPTHIPELDALLAASGLHDGMEMERRMQSALLCGLQGRRLLQNRGI